MREKFAGVLRRKRHRCPPDVTLRLFLNGELVLGPVTGEELAYMIRFSGESEVDLLQTIYWDGESPRVAVLGQYLPPKRR